VWVRELFISCGIGAGTYLCFPRRSLLHSLYIVAIVAGFCNPGQLLRTKRYVFCFPRRSLLDINNILISSVSSVNVEPYQQKQCTVKLHCIVKYWKQTRIGPCTLYLNPVGGVFLSCNVRIRQVRW